MSREQQLRRPPGLRPSRGEWRELPTDHAQRLVDGPIVFDEAAIMPGQSLPQMLELLRSGDLPPDCRAVLGSVVVRVWDRNGRPNTRLWQLLRAWLVTPPRSGRGRWLGCIPPGWDRNRNAVSITAIPVPLKWIAGAGSGASSSLMAAATARRHRRWCRSAMWARGRC